MTNDKQFKRENQRLIYLQNNKRKQVSNRATEQKTTITELQASSFGNKARLGTLNYFLANLHTSF